MAALMAVASLAGGWLGAHVAQRLPPAGMRAFAIAVGLFAAGKFLLRCRIDARRERCSAAPGRS